MFYRRITKRATWMFQWSYFIRYKNAKNSWTYRFKKL